MDLNNLINNPIVRSISRNDDEFDRNAMKFFMKNTPENARTMDRIEDSYYRRNYLDFTDNGSLGSNSWPRNRANNTNNDIDPALLGVMREIKRILKTDEFYEILDLGELSTQEEIKEAYQTLASQFHPEACKEKGAADAFVKLAQAYDCLGDVEKRRIYNKCCEDDPDHPERAYRRYYKFNKSPEEVFKNSYGQAPSQSASTDENDQKYKKANKAYNANNTGKKKTLLAYLAVPVIYLMVLVLVAAGLWLFVFKTSDNGIYSFTQNSKYTVQKETKKLGLKYYIQSYPEAELSELKLVEIAKLGERVEKDYVGKLEAECNSATKEKENLREAMYGVTLSAVRETLYQKMNAIDTSSCDKLYDVKRGRRPQVRDYSNEASD